MVNPETIKQLIEKANILCDSIKDLPCGCDGCWLSNEIEDNEETDEQTCPFEAIKKIVKEQLGE